MSWVADGHEGSESPKFIMKHAMDKMRMQTL